MCWGRGRDTAKPSAFPSAPATLGLWPPIFSAARSLWAAGGSTYGDNARPRALRPALTLPRRPPAPGASSEPEGRSQKGRELSAHGRSANSDTRIRPRAGRGQHSAARTNQRATPPARSGTKGGTALCGVAKASALGAGPCILYRMLLYAGFCFVLF